MVGRKVERRVWRGEGAWGWGVVWGGRGGAGVEGAIGDAGAELVESVSELRLESEEEESASDDEGCSGDVYLVMRVLWSGN